VGDDRLQRMAGRSVNPDTFTHLRGMNCSWTMHILSNRGGAFPLRYAIVDTCR
jgi:hypothetical protein